MVDINPKLQRRLASWRQTTGVVEPSPGRLGASGGVRGRLRSKNRLFRILLLDTVVELDLTLCELESYLDQGERSALHTKRLDERAAYALQVYERAVARLLDQEVGNVLQDPPREREVIKTVYVKPPAQSWYQRLFGANRV
jgi:hypothetical protein